MRPVVVWRLCDGKRGHENQSAGLIEALAGRAPLVVHRLDVAPGGRLRTALSLLARRRAATLPDPVLLVGAGHATHAALLAGRRARGGRAVVLMRPSLPRAWFDLCIAPEHDGLARAPNTLITRGALNRMRPGEGPREGPGLILVGGPSRHHRWDTAVVVAQIRALAERDPGRWQVATSRRTPRDFLGTLAAAVPRDLEPVPVDAVDADWLPARLARAPAAWATEDSVSMVYEALSAGAATGVLAVPRRDGPPGRVVRGLDRLATDGLVTTFEAWREGAALRAPDVPLDEAGRCAAWIAERWLRGA
jgi:mitochondrial fission protein ELM1